MTVLFWGSSDFSIPALELIYNKYRILSVITNPDTPFGRNLKEIHHTPVKLFAVEKGIPVLQPEDLKDASFQQKVKSIKADISVVVSYGFIIPENLLNISPCGFINLHASLLPKYRGASPIQASLLNGDSVTGVTIQYLSKELDKGDIILQREVNILENDNYITLSKRLSEEGAHLLIEAIELISKGKAERKAQDEKLATMTHRIKKEDGFISFSLMSAKEIFNRWRAYYSWPGIYSMYKNSSASGEKKENSLTISLLEIEKQDRDASTEPGKIIQSDKKALIVKCKEGGIRILKLKPWGKKEMDYISFINGYKPVTGNYW